ncbi:hypothetical protein BJ878DRAFT_544577 [Calycina marina]|uniref:Calcineurin-like phosphoesterase domain-containing protein n=1 Tax=Calycina marina TaxID=1763456 RepID=A0A9P7YYK9_9HELO|nr:hypothetical protein BJ878DRAFT_544577 [Calycina marina]
MALGVLFDFKGNSNVSVITPAADLIQEQWLVNTVNYEQPIDLFVVVIGHNPINPAHRSCKHFRRLTKSYAILRPDIPIQILGGHVHIRDLVVYNDKLTGLEPDGHLPLT